MGFGLFCLSGFSDEIAADFDVQLAVVRSLGMKFIELRGADGQNVSEFSTDKEDVLVDKLRAAGVGVSSIGSPLGKADIREDFSLQVELLERLIRFGKKLGTKYIRMFSFYIPEGEDPQEHRQEVLDRIRVLRDRAAEADMVLLHENEKGIYGDTADHCFDLMQELGSPAFGAVFDFANFVQCGEDTLRAFEMLKPYICYVHIKDADGEKRIVPAGQGCGHLEEILTELYKDGYKGFLSLEPHLADFVGFGALEASGNEIKDSADRGEAAFRLAHDALVRLLPEGSIL